MMHMHLMLKEKQLNVFHNRFKQSSNIKQYLASKLKKKCGGFINICLLLIFIDYVVELIHEFKCSLKCSFS